MNRGVAVALDSFRLANVGAQIPCLICKQSNSQDAETCRGCHAPMILTRQAESHAAPPLMLAALGPSGVGKTVYLGMLLDILSRQPARLQLSARGGFSVTLQQKTMAALARCEFPSKTPNEPDRWDWVHCQLRAPEREEGIELVLPDVAGEALFAEVDHPRTHLAIHSLLSRCHGVLVLIDAAKLQSGSLDEDHFSMKLVSHLSESCGTAKIGWGDRPVAVILSKADQCRSCFDDPAAFAARHAPGLLRLCQQRFKNYQFFAVGVAGACVTRETTLGGTENIPLRIEPRGIVEPFEWLVRNAAH